MIGLLPLRTSQLSYPGLAPGFDPTHPAAAGCVANRGFSGVPSFGSAQYRNILTGKRANTVTGVPTRNFWGVIGPTTVFNATTMALSFTGQSAVTPTSVTVGGIFYATNVVTGNTQVVMHSGTCNFSTFNNVMFVNIAGTNISTGMTVLVNTPYFFASSMQASLQNAVLINLRTGQIQTSITTNAATPGAPGNVVVGNANLSTQGASGGVAAAMWSRAFLSIPQLIAWANDPWSFWYPRTIDLGSAISTPASGSVSLTAAVGTFTETGEPAPLDVGLTSAFGSFAETGEAATTNIGLTAAFGSFALTGEPVTFNTAVVAASGSFTETGEAATTDEALTAAFGSYALTGEDAGLAAGGGVTLAAAFGAFTDTGEPIIFDIGALAASAVFAETGNATIFDEAMMAGFGAYVLTGLPIGGGGAPEVHARYFFADVGSLMGR